MTSFTKEQFIELAKMNCGIERSSALDVIDVQALVCAREMIHFDNARHELLWLLNFADCGEIGSSEIRKALKVIAELQEEHSIELDNLVRRR